MPLPHTSLTPPLRFHRFHRPGPMPSCLLCMPHPLCLAPLSRPLSRLLDVFSRISVLPLASRRFALSPSFGSSHSFVPPVDLSASAILIAVLPPPFAKRLSTHAKDRQRFSLRELCIPRRSSYSHTTFAISFRATSRHWCTCSIPRWALHPIYHHDLVRRPSCVKFTRTGTGP